MFLEYTSQKTIRIVSSNCLFINIQYHDLFHLFAAFLKTHKNVHRRSYPYISIKAKNAITEITRI